MEIFQKPTTSAKPLEAQ